MVCLCIASRLHLLCLWFALGLFSGFAFGLRVVSFWFASVRFWFAFGLLLVCLRFAVGLPFVYLWFAFGLLLVHLWFAFGLLCFVFVQIPVPQKLQFISFFWGGGGVALEIMWTPTPQKNATLFWDERSVWWPLKARKQLFVGSVVIILVVFEPFPFRATSFWRGPRASNVLPGASGRTILVGVPPFEHFYCLAPPCFTTTPPSKVQRKMKFHWGTPPLKLQLLGGKTFGQLWPALVCFWFASGLLLVCL